MAEFLRRHARQVRENERLLLDGIDVRINSIDAPGRLNLNPGGWVAGVLRATGAGAAASAGAVNAAVSFGTASTGATIAGLSGVAAESATLAWLGGGSLAAGGGWNGARGHGAQFCHDRPGAVGRRARGGGPRKTSADKSERKNHRSRSRDGPDGSGEGHARGDRQANF